MSLNKILSLTSLLCLLYVSSVSACPTIDLENLQCETSTGYSYTIDYVKVEENLYSFQVFGIPVQMKLPTEESNVVKAVIYCDGNQIVRYETFKNMSAVSVTKFENNSLTIKGNRISTKCDSSESCDDDDHSFDGLIQENIVCRL